MREITQAVGQCNTCSEGWTHAGLMPATAAFLRRKDLTVILKNIFLQGIFPFDGAGLEKAVPIHSQLSHFVPDGVINQTLYFRGGNSSEELITVVLMRDGVPMRYFPIGAKGDVNVPLRVVEDIDGGSLIELRLLAADGVSGIRRGRHGHGGALMTAWPAAPGGARRVTPGAGWW